jgi:putative membrane protein
MKKETSTVFLGNRYLNTYLISACLIITACNNRNEKDISLNQPVDAVGAAMNPDQGSPVNDSEMVVKAYTSGVEEAELADQVKGQLSNKELQKLAEMMSTEHRRINSELKAVAEKKDIPLPLGALKSEADEFLSAHTQNGEAFDKAYADKLVEDHNKALDLYTKLSQNAKDKEVREFFQQHVDLINHHLYMAQIMRDSVITTKARQK